MNEVIERAFTDFTVDGVEIPVSFLRYHGEATAYITYMLEASGDPLGGDDEIVAYVDYYDFDIYTKGNYFPIAEEVKRIMRENGFVWQPTRSSSDMFEEETGYYHKTLSFAIERSN